MKFKGVEICTYGSYSCYDWKQDSLQPLVQLQTKIVLFRVRVQLPADVVDVHREDVGPAAGAGGVLCHNGLTPGGGDHQAPVTERDAHS